MLTLSQVRRAKKFRVGVMMVMMSAFCASSSRDAVAAYDRPVAWTEMSDLDLKSAIRSQYASSGNLYDSLVDEQMIDLALQDVDQKISKDFKVHPVIKAPVKFWLSIYTQYSTKQIVIFDSNHMDIVYEVIDLRPIELKSRNLVVYEILSNRKILATLEAYKKAFAALVRNPKPKKPTREQAIILAKTKNLKHKHSFKELAANVKSMRGQRDNIIKGLVAAESFFPKMDAMFNQMKVPSELLRLSLVESSFNLKAISKVGASGVWQLMPTIGKKYLTMDDKTGIDERRSPLKATVAAGKLLTWNYKYLGNWPLAIISYNHGLKNLPRFKDHTLDFNRMANLFNGCIKKPLLGWASRNYYSEFLAVVYAEAYRDLFYGKTPSNALTTLAYRQLEKRQSAYAFALERGIALQQIKHLNADLEDLKAPLPAGFWVAVPSDQDDIIPMVEYSLHPKSKIKAIAQAKGKATAKSKPTKKIAKKTAAHKGHHPSKSSKVHRKVAKNG